MSDTVLMNFYIPKRLKTRLEEICDLRHLSRTSFILTTLEPEIEKWEGKLTTQPPRFRDHKEPPVFFSSFDDERMSDDW